MQEIVRTKRNPFVATIGTTDAQSDVLALGLVSSFAIVIPPSVASATLTFYGGSAEDEPFYPIHLSNEDLAVLQVSGGRVYIAPPELFCVQLIKIVSTVGFEGTILSKG